jgi:hypothetical protein
MLYYPTKKTFHGSGPKKRGFNRQDLNKDYGDLRYMKAGMHTEVLNHGSPPPCLETMQQCRGCFGWPNMLNAAYHDDIWRKYPLRCPCTGLVLKVVWDNK